VRGQVAARPLVHELVSPCCFNDLQDEGRKSEHDDEQSTDFRQRH
jgi:hypothetical protein